MHGIVLTDTNGVTFALPFSRHKLHQAHWLAALGIKSSKEYWNKVNYENGEDSGIIQLNRYEQTQDENKVISNL